MKERLKWAGPALLIAALAVAAYCLLAYESEYLWKVQELNLHLHTPLFLKQQMVTSGWLLTWLGTWFTEFFYHPWLGVTLLCLLWALLMAVLWRTFRVPLKWAVVLLIPVAALLVSDVDLGYWIYYLKLRGHFFAATIGTTLAALAVWLYRLMPARLLMRPLFMVLSTAVLLICAFFQTFRLFAFQHVPLGALTRTTLLQTAYSLFFTIPLAGLVNRSVARGG